MCSVHLILIVKTDKPNIVGDDRIFAAKFFVTLNFAVEIFVARILVAKTYRRVEFLPRRFFAFSPQGSFAVKNFRWFYVSPLDIFAVRIFVAWKESFYFSFLYNRAAMWASEASYRQHSVVVGWLNLKTGAGSLGCKVPPENGGMRGVGAPLIKSLGSNYLLYKPSIFRN